MVRFNGSDVPDVEGCFYDNDFLKAYMESRNQIPQSYIDTPKLIDSYLNSIFLDEKQKLIILDVNSGNAVDAIRYKKMYPNSTVYAFESTRSDEAEFLIGQNGCDGIILSELLINHKNGFEYVYSPEGEKKTVQCQTMLGFVNSMKFERVSFIDYKFPTVDILSAFGDVLRSKVMSMMVRVNENNRKELEEILFQNNFVVYDKNSCTFDKEILRSEFFYVNTLFFKANES